MVDEIERQLLLDIDSRARKILNKIGKCFKNGKRCLISEAGNWSLKKELDLTIEVKVEEVLDNEEIIKARLVKEIEEKELKLFGVRSYYGVYEELNVVTTESNGRFKLYFYELVGEF